MASKSGWSGFSFNSLNNFDLIRDKTCSQTLPVSVSFHMFRLNSQTERHF